MNFIYYIFFKSQVNLVITDLNDLSNYIKNFGLLTISNRESNETTNQFLRNTSTNYNNTNSINHFNYNNTTSHQPQPQQPRPRQTWNRNAESLNDILPAYNQPPTPRNRPSQSSERPIFGGGGGSGGAQVNQNNRRAQVASPVGFNVNFEPSRAANNQNRNRNANIQNTQSARDSNDTIRPPIRSNTFVLEDQSQNEPSPNQPTRAVDVNALYDVRRRARAKTPMTFNIMLDDPSANLQFDDSGQILAPATGLSNATQMPLTTNQPKVNYSAKTRAKMIIGKQGRENGQFIWPVDISINNFNSQIIVADSNNHRIQIFESDGKFLKTFGRQGNRDSQFDSVSGIFIDSMSNIFVVDRLNHRKFNLLKIHFFIFFKVSYHKKL